MSDLVDPRNRPDPLQLLGAPSGNEQLAGVQAQRAASAAAARRALQVTGEQKIGGNEWALALEFAKRAGVPPEQALVMQRADPAGAAAAQVDLSQLAHTNPRLVSWLGDLRNAPLGADDINALRDLESSINSGRRDTSFLQDLGNSTELGLARLSAQMYHLAVAYGRKDPREAAEGAAQVYARIAELQAREPASLQDYREAVANAGHDTNTAWRRFLDAWHAVRTGEVPFMESGSALSSTLLDAGMEGIDQAFEAVSRPRSFVLDNAEQSANSLPSLALGAGGGALAGPAGFLAGSATGEFATEVGAWIDQGIMARGIDPSDPAALEKLYRDQAFMSSMRSQGQLKGLGTTAVDILFEAFAGKFITERPIGGKRTLGGTVKAAVKDVAVQAAGESTSEGAGQVLESLGTEGDLSQVDLSEVVLEGVLGGGPAVGKVTIGAYSRRASAPLRRMLAKGFLARLDAQRMSKGAEAWTKSKAAKLHAPRVRALFEVAAGDSGISTVRIALPDWNAYWNGQKLSPGQAFEDVVPDHRAGWGEAQQTGVVEIPVGAYMEKLAGTEHFDGLLPVSRLRADGLTLGEADQAITDLSEEVRAAQEAATASSKQERDTRGSIEQLDTQLAIAQSTLPTPEEQQTAQAELADAESAAGLEGQLPPQLAKDVLAMLQPPLQGQDEPQQPGRVEQLLTGAGVDVSQLDMAGMEQRFTQGREQVAQSLQRITTAREQVAGQQAAVENLATLEQQRGEAQQQLDQLVASRVQEEQLVERLVSEATSGLVAAGRKPRDARMMAEAQVQFLRVRSLREGLPMQELLAQFPLAFMGSRPQQQRAAPGAAAPAAAPTTPAVTERRSTSDSGEIPGAAARRSQPQTPAGAAVAGPAAQVPTSGAPPTEVSVQTPAIVPGSAYADEDPAALAQASIEELVGIYRARAAAMRAVEVAEGLQAQVLVVPAGKRRPSTNARKAAGARYDRAKDELGRVESQLDATMLELAAAFGQDGARHLNDQALAQLQAPSAGAAPSRGVQQHAEPIGPQQQQAQGSGAPKVLGRSTRIHTIGGSYPATFALVELDDLVPSHQVESRPTGRVFVADPRYPADLQPRDYGRLTGEQGKVERIASELAAKADLFLGDSSTPTDGPPIATTDDIVLNGNGRTMALKLADQLGLYAPYLQALSGTEERYGLPAGAAATMRKPVLVRVVDMDARSPEAFAFAREGNESLTQQQSLEDRMSALKAVLPESALTLDVPEDTTLAEFLNSDSRDARRTLDAIWTSLAPNLRPAFFTEQGVLNQVGREAIARLLLTAVFNEDTVTPQRDAMKALLVKAIPAAAAMQRELPDELNLSAPLDAALRYGVEQLENWAHPPEQELMFGGDRNPFLDLDPLQQRLVRFLSANWRRDSALRQLLAEYVKFARGSSMLGVAGVLPTDALDAALVEVQGARAAKAKPAPAPAAAPPAGPTLLQGPAGPDLYVVHNLTVENLAAVGRLGGLAAPSLAVLPRTEGVAVSEKYGAITLVGTRALGDPASVPVFDADVYSAVFPPAEYSPAKTKHVQASRAKLAAIGKQFEEGGVITYAYEQHSFERPDPAQLRYELSRTLAARVAYLRSLGLTVEAKQQPASLRYEFVRMPALQAFFREHGTDHGARPGDPYFTQLTVATRAAVQEWAESLPEDLDEQDRAGLLEQLIDEHTGEVAFGPADRLMRDMAVAGSTQLDKEAAATRVDELMIGEGPRFLEWIDANLLPPFGEAFLRIGGRREPYTLENIVRKMNAGAARGAEGSLTFGEGMTRAVVALRFRTLERMRAAARTQVASEGQVNEAREQAKAGLSSWRAAVIGYYAYSGVGATWNALDSSMKALAGWAASSGRQAADLRRALERQEFSAVPADVLEQGVRAGEAWMAAPVPYVEAKPRRAVHLGEFAGAAIPQDLDEASRSILRAAGVAMHEYAPGGRQAAVEALLASQAAAGKAVLFQSEHGRAPDEAHEAHLDVLNDGGVYLPEPDEVAEPGRQRIDKPRDLPGQSFLPFSNTPGQEQERAVSRGQLRPVDDQELSALLNGRGGGLQPGDRVSSLLADLVRGDLASVVPVRGARVRTPRDVAALAAAYRSPFVERLVWFLVGKDGTVKRNGLWSIGLIDSTMGPGGQEFDALVDQLGAEPGDTMYWSHNHPSGNPSPSTQDEDLYGRLRMQLARRGMEFQGLVLDHERFALDVASLDRHWSTQGYEAQSFFRPVGGRRVDNNAQVAELARGIGLQPGSLLAVHINSKNGVVGLEAFAEAPTEKELKASRDASAGGRTILVGMGPGTLLEAAGKIHDPRVLDMVELMPLQESAEPQGEPIVQKGDEGMARLRTLWDPPSGRGYRSLQDIGTWTPRQGSGQRLPGAVNVVRQGENLYRSGRALTYHEEFTGYYFIDGHLHQLQVPTEIKPTRDTHWMWAFSNAGDLHSIDVGRRPGQDEQVYEEDLQGANPQQIEGRMLQGGAVAIRRYAGELGVDVAGDAGGKLNTAGLRKAQQAVAALPEEVRAQVTHVTVGAGLGHFDGLRVARASFEAARGLGQLERDVRLSLEQGGAERGPRGSLSFGASTAEGVPRAFTMAFLAKADRSTFFHELGHYWFEVMGDLAQRAGASPQLQLDYARMLSFVGLRDRAEHLSRLQEARDIQAGAAGRQLTPQEQLRLSELAQPFERWAQAFEVYIRDGQAPVPALRGLFAAFAEWMTRLYRSAKELGGPISPEIREVMDRMVATDDELANARESEGRDALFVDPADVGMSAVEADRYRELAGRARLRRRELLMQRLMRDRERERQGAWQDRMSELREEARRQFHQRPEAQAFYALKWWRRPDGSDLPEGQGHFKLDRAEIERRYGARSATARKLRRNALDNQEAGMSLDAAAEVFGFGSGDELVKGLLAAADEDELVEAVAAKRMAEQHPELLADQAKLRAAAGEAFDNEEQRELVRAELATLWRLAKARGRQEQRDAGAEHRKATFRPLPDSRQLAQEARAILRTRPLHEVAPDAYLSEARRQRLRAAAAVTSGRWEIADEALRLEALHVELAHQAQDLTEHAGAIVNYARGLTRPASQRALTLAGGNFKAAANAILEDVDLRPATDPQLRDRAAIRRFVEEREEAGLSHQLDPELVARSRTTHWRELTIGQLEDVRDALRQIEHDARDENWTTFAEGRRRTDDLVSELLASLTAARPEKVQATGSTNKLERKIESVGDFINAHKRTATFFRQWDGGEEGGPWRRFFGRVIQRAQVAEHARNAAEIRWLIEDLYGKHFSKAQLADMESMRPERVNLAGLNLTHEDRLFIALNWGNVINRSRLLTDTKRWSQAQLHDVLGSLDANDWRFVQAVWDHLETFWPEIAAKSERTTGAVPERVEPHVDGQLRAAAAKYGVDLRGGYFPIKYRDSKAVAMSMADLASQSMKGAFTASTTRRGHEQARMASVNRPLRLDRGVLLEHLTEVVHDLTHHEALIHVNKLLRDKRVVSAIEERAGRGAVLELQAWVQDVAAGQVGSRRCVEKMLAALRTGAVVQRLGFNLLTGGKQFNGLAQAAVRIGWPALSRGLARVISDTTMMRNTFAFPAQHSEFMAARPQTIQRDISEAYQRLQVRRRNRVMAMSMGIIGRFQYVVDTIIWHGAYEKALGGLDVAERSLPEHELEAVARADEAVSDSQGGGMVADLAAIERGGAYQRVWSTFITGSIANVNLAMESVGRAKRGDAASILRTTADLLTLYTMPVVVGAAIASVFGSGGGKDPWWLELLEEQGAYLLDGWVLFRELGGAVRGFDYHGSAGGQAFQDFYRLATQVRQGDDDRAFWEAFADFGGVVTKLPTTAGVRAIEGLDAAIDGRAKGLRVLLAPITGPNRDER